MQKSYTDFLVSDCTFLLGAATVFSIGGMAIFYNRSATPAQADARALKQDFAMIGQDIRDVAAALEKQSSEQLPLGL